MGDPKGRFFSLQYQIFILFLLVSSLPLVLIAVLAFRMVPRLLVEQAATSRLLALRQAAAMADRSIGDIENASLFLIQAEESRAFLAKAEEKASAPKDAESLLYRTMVFFLDPEQGLIAASMKNAAGKTVSADPYYLHRPFGEEELARMKAERGGGVWYGEDLYARPGGERVAGLSLGRLVLDPLDLGDELGYLKLTVNLTSLVERMGRSVAEDHGKMAVILPEAGLALGIDQEDGRIGALPEDEAEAAEAAPEGIGWIRRRIGGRDSIVLRAGFADGKGKLVRILPTSRLTEEGRSLQDLLLAATLATLAACAGLSFAFSSAFLSPLRRFSVACSALAGADFRHRINSGRADEIGLLARAFDDMSARLERSVAEVYETRIKQREAELAALQARINPHFLYNVLDSLY